MPIVASWQLRAMWAPSSLFIDGVTGPDRTRSWHIIMRILTARDDCIFFSYISIVSKTKRSNKYQTRALRMYIESETNADSANMLFTEWHAMQSNLKNTVKFPCEDSKAYLSSLATHHCRQSRMFVDQLTQQMFRPGTVSDPSYLIRAQKRAHVIQWEHSSCFRYTVQLCLKNI